MSEPDSDPVFAQFEKAGEKRVAEDLALGRYNEKRAKAASHWLNTKAQDRAEASMRAQMEIAREASDAATRAADSASDSAASARDMARAARSANTRATIALIAAIAIAAAAIIRLALDWSQTNGG